MIIRIFQVVVGILVEIQSFLCPGKPGGPVIIMALLRRAIVGASEFQLKTTNKVCTNYKSVSFSFISCKVSRVIIY